MKARKQIDIIVDCLDALEWNFKYTEGESRRRINLEELKLLIYNTDKKKLIKESK